jgi:hypothetical protein
MCSALPCCFSPTHGGGLAICWCQLKWLHCYVSGVLMVRSYVAYHCRRREAQALYVPETIISRPDRSLLASHVRLGSYYL